MKKKNLKLIYLLIISVFLFSCEKNGNEPEVITNEIIESFCFETGIEAVYVIDTSLLSTVMSWQGSGDYPGVDDWATAKIPNNFNLYGGLPGQSEYYSIDLTIIDADTIKVDYWESLQVKAHPEFGYRPMVGVFYLKDTIVVAISKTLANPQYGEGGAWQIYVEHFTEDLMVSDTIYLK
ncbi:hypothetical protein ACFLSI_01620 [Bacteroidota bacterium]